MSSSLHLILPAAGLGSRFKDVGEMRPKPLIPVFNIPMIVWVILNFPLNRGDKIWIISQRSDRLPELLEVYLSKFDFDIDFIEIDGVTEGPASTAALALELVPDDCPVIIANTDQFVFTDLVPFVDAVRKNEVQGQILTMKASSPAWSYVGRNKFGEICEVVEKVEISDEATVGVYGWGESRFAVASFRHTFESNNRTNGEFYVAPTYNFLLQNGYAVRTFMVGDHGIAVHGLGTPKDLADFLTNQSALEFADKFFLAVGQPG
jgi:dTDP-glucose pyrophosphorylase